MVRASFRRGSAFQLSTLVENSPVGELEVTTRHTVLPRTASPAASSTSIVIRADATDGSIVCGGEVNVICVIPAAPAANGIAILVAITTVENPFKNLSGNFACLRRQAIPVFMSAIITRFRCRCKWLPLGAARRLRD